LEVNLSYLIFVGHFYQFFN